MTIFSIREILNKSIEIKKKITINGWIKTKRDSKIGLSFLDISDGSCINALQVVVEKKIKNYNLILKLTSGCSVSITGILLKSIGKKQKIELKALNVKILGYVEDPNKYPISPKKHSMKFLREVAHLRPRTNIIGAISRIRHTVAKLIHDFFDYNGFLWVTTPIITSYDCEGAGKMFRVSSLELNNIEYEKNKKDNSKKEFFGKESFLTVSGQLNNEAYACALSKVYTFGPTFRAENSNTRRHLSEFWMIEPELAFSNLEDIIKLAENLLKYIFKNIINIREDDLVFLEKKTDKIIIKKLKNIIDSKFIKINYYDVIKLLNKSKNYNIKKILWGEDISSEQEDYLIKIHNNNPIIIINYPKKIKAFYMRLNSDNKTVSAVDIIFPEIGEIIGGSQREERLSYLDERLKEFKLNKNIYWWYRDLRKYGTVPHSGFGLGFERLIIFITGIKNIRDVIPFPRTSKNINF